MGGNASKETDNTENNSILTQHIQNYQSVPHNRVDKEDKETIQNIETIKKDLHENPELFLLNNMIMSVMFFEDYPKLTEEVKRDILDKNHNFVIPDAIFDKVNQNIAFRPYHGTHKNYSVPLVSKRIFVLNDWIKVLGYTENSDESENQITVTMEESQKKGYVRLRATNVDHLIPNSPVTSLNSIEPNSRSSEDSTDTNYYTELQELKTPKPIEIIEELQKHEKSVLQNTLPHNCISYRKVKKLSWDPEELNGENLTDDDLYLTVPYVNSKRFMENLENNLFLNGVASKLGFDIEDIDSSERKRERIYCVIKEDDKVLPCELLPCVKCSWPSELTLKFNMKRYRKPEGRKRWIYPTNRMVSDILSLDCVLLPKGQVRKRSNANMTKKTEEKDIDIEWEVNFPQAQRYLESYMSHAQMKSLLILLTLHKTYIEPKTTDFGLLTDHIRNFILWECESNYTDWPEHRLGIKLLEVIKNLNDHLSKHRPNIPDFFINERNTLNEVPNQKIKIAQQMFDEIIQSPVMSFLKALRNLRYKNGKTFFTPFDFKKFYNILIKKGIEVVNIRKLQNRTINPEIAFESLLDGKKREKIYRKRLENKKRELEKIQLETNVRRGSADSIDMEWVCEKKFDLYKMRALLKFFIDTFLEIAEKCMSISTKKLARFYLKQAFYLTRILRDECPSFVDDVTEYLEQIDDLEKRVENSNSNITEIEKLKNKSLSIIETKLNNTKDTTETEKKHKLTQNGPRKSVAFVENHKSQ